MEPELTSPPTASTPTGAPGLPPSPWWKRFGWRVTLGVILYVIIGGIAIAVVPDQLLANWFPDLSSEERAEFLGPAANTVLFALGGTIALVGVGLSLSRHRQELEAANRDRARLLDDQDRERARREEADVQRRSETERALRDRFVTTVNLLSDPSPVNRQAALYALGALADDWDAFGKPDEVQVCIEVLTGYLRAPRSNEMLLELTEEEHAQLDDAPARRDAARTTVQEVAVKQAGYAVISNHLQRNATPNWHDRSFNLSGAHIDFRVGLFGELSSAGKLDFEGATIRVGGVVDLQSMILTGGASVDLARAKISGGAFVNLSGAEITDTAYVSLTRAEVSGAYVSLVSATISDRGCVRLGEATVSDDGFVDLKDSKIGGADRRLPAFVNLDGTEITGGTVSFADAAISGRGRLYAIAVITGGGRLNLRGATISAVDGVHLLDVEVSDYGLVDLQGALICDGGSVAIQGATILDGGSMDMKGLEISDGGSVHLEGETIDPGGWLIQPDGSRRSGESM